MVGRRASNTRTISRTGWCSVLKRHDVRGRAASDPVPADRRPATQGCPWGAAFLLQGRPRCGKCGRLAHSSSVSNLDSTVGVLDLGESWTHSSPALEVGEQPAAVGPTTRRPWRTDPRSGRRPSPPARPGRSYGGQSRPRRPPRHGPGSTTGSPSGLESDRSDRPKNRWVTLVTAISRDTNAACTSQPSPLKRAGRFILDHDPAAAAQSDGPRSTATNQPPHELSR
jgi:hypothetical protein